MTHVELSYTAPDATASYFTRSIIDDIARCASLLPELENITLMETAVTPAGERKLREKLPDLQIQVITPILDRKNTSIRRY